MVGTEQMIMININNTIQEGFNFSRLVESIGVVDEDYNVLNESVVLAIIRKFINFLKRIKNHFVAVIKFIKSRITTVIGLLKGKKEYADDVEINVETTDVKYYENKIDDIYQIIKSKGFGAGMRPLDDDTLEKFDNCTTDLKDLIDEMDDDNSRKKEAKFRNLSEFINTLKFYITGIENSIKMINFAMSTAEHMNSMSAKGEEVNSSVQKYIQVSTATVNAYNTLIKHVHNDIQNCIAEINKRSVESYEDSSWV